MNFRQNKKNKPKFNVNRLHFVMAIIFLLAGFIIFKLYSLQILKHDLYIALAMDQHQVLSQLNPERGKIFVQNSPQLLGSDIYPAAGDKEFASVFAVPSEIEKPKEIAEKLYDFFDHEEVVAEVEEKIAQDDYFNDIFDEEGNIIDKQKHEFMEIKKEIEIKAKKEEIIESYIVKLSKPNDPYEPIRKKITKEKLDELLKMELQGIHHTMETYRYYPDVQLGSHVFGFVGYREGKEQGMYGLEGFFNDELSGKMGSVRTERAAGGGLVIINDREFNRPVNGQDLVLTINRSIQFVVCEKIKEKVLSHGSESGTVIVMEPNTGAIIAMCSYPDYDSNDYNKVEDPKIYNNPAIFDQYEPGSIFKSFTMAAGIDSGKISPETTYEDQGYIMIEGWNKPIKNSDFETYGAHGVVDMVSVLELSLNTGSIFVMKKVGGEKFAEYVKNFGFGEKTGIELETEYAGNIRNLQRDFIRPVEAATASFGQGITVTPLQMVTAYAAIANGGMLMKPYIVGKVINGDKEEVTEPRQIRRVISEKAAMLTAGILVNVVDGGHAKKAAVEGYYVAGKTGTAQVASSERKGYGDKTIHTFVGFAPVDDPKFVMLVKLNDPKDVQFSASSAAPLFGELAKFILNYYQVPKER